MCFFFKRKPRHYTLDGVEAWDKECRVVGEPITREALQVTCTRCLHNLTRVVVRIRRLEQLKEWGDREAELISSDLTRLAEEARKEAKEGD